jgi:hypothetical protein
VAIRVELTSRISIARRFVSAAFSSGICFRIITISKQKGRVQMIRQPTNSIGGTVSTRIR